MRELGIWVLTNYFIQYTVQSKCLWKSLMNFIIDKSKSIPGKVSQSNPSNSFRNSSHASSTDFMPPPAALCPVGFGFDLVWLLGSNLVGPATEEVGIFGPITVGTTGFPILTAVGTKRVASRLMLRIWGAAEMTVSPLALLCGSSTLGLTTLKRTKLSYKNGIFLLEVQQKWWPKNGGRVGNQLWLVVLLELDCLSSCHLNALSNLKNFEFQVWKKQKYQLDIEDARVVAVPFPAWLDLDQLQEQPRRARGGNRWAAVEAVVDQSRTCHRELKIDFKVFFLFTHFPRAHNPHPRPLLGNHPLLFDWAVLRNGHAFAFHPAILNPLHLLLLHCLLRMAANRVVDLNNLQIQIVIPNKVKNLVDVCAASWRLSSSLGFLPSLPLAFGRVFGAQ